MNLLPSSLYTFAKLWSVLKLFLIPIGGGIPSGVLMARDQGFVWQVTLILYLISDVILACIFEPILLIFISLSKRSVRLQKVGEVFKKVMKQTSSRYGTTGGAFTIIMIAFGADPMTGRSVAVAAGHGFIKGWIFAITGDMLYFGVLMISTLWLDGILGNGTSTTIIILIAMMVVPGLVNRWRKKTQQG